MVLWIGLAVMSAAVLAALLAPLLRRLPAVAATDAMSTAIYRDQLREIDGERERGLLGDAEHAAARAEIARRLLAADSAAIAARTAARYAKSADTLVGRIALGLAALLPVTAISLYLAFGAPHLPSQPLLARLQDPAATARVDDLVRAVELRLRVEPEDGQGWDVIAPVYLKQGRVREAADAFAKAARILGENSRRLAGFAEATVLASDGIVTEPARNAYERLSKLEPARPEPRFWLALAKEQDGRLADAVADYDALLASAPPDANWRQHIEERLGIVRGKLGPPSMAMPQSKPAPVTVARGPSADDMAAADKLAPDDRRKMIEGMVEGLAERLSQNGRDLPGWERLIRAYTVMGRRSEAVAALKSARRSLSGEAASLAALAHLALSLGLES